MKNITYILLLLIGLTSTLKSQSWCPAGAEWHYGYIYFNQVGDVHYRYTADTIIKNVACKKIEVTDYNGQYYNNSPYFVVDTLPPKPLYTYAQNDTVFFYYEQHNSWFPVYFFNAQVGDTLTTPNADTWFGVNDFLIVVVDSIGTMSINDSILRFYNFHLADTCISASIFKGKVIEKIGLLSGLRPNWYCVSDQRYYHFCSYNDDAFPVYPSTATCQLRPIGIEELDIGKIDMHLFPNPANEIITIASSETENNITISDITGHVVNTFTVSQPSITLPVADYTPGVYIVTMSNRKGFTSSQRLIIMR